MATPSNCASPAVLSANRRVLVIDDNRAIHDDFRKILTGRPAAGRELDQAEASLFGATDDGPISEGFEVDSAFQGLEGLERVRQALAAGKPYAMAFIDVRMPPGWDGIETTAQIWQADPDVQVVICTAYSDYSWEAMMAKVGVSDRLVILKKPFDNIEVWQLAHALTEKWLLLQNSRLKTRQLETMVSVRTHELQQANEQLKTEIVEREKTEEALRQSQKMEALGQLAGGIAHDFNNLITIIQGYAQCLVAEHPRSPDELESLERIIGASDRAARLVSQMLMFGRKKRMQPRHLDLKGVVTELGKMLDRILGEDIAMHIECPGTPLPVYADPAMIEQVVMNLAVNARDAMPRGGQLKIQMAETELTEADTRRNTGARPGRFARISVTDTGCGIAPAALPRLFEPFFTTKEPGRGTGLGLATVYGIVNQHNGCIEVKSQPGQGARFDVFLPLDDPENLPSLVSPAYAKIPASIPSGNETILLVEDEPAVRHLAQNILQRRGYKILIAASGPEALATWNEYKAGIDLVLTDMVMPDGLTGLDLAEKLQQEDPRLRVVFTTGYSLDAIGQNFSLEEGLNFLAKPYTPHELALTVRQCLDNPASGASRA